jgi:2-dehydro-3-deoxygalactonokinase
LFDLLAKHSVLARDGGEARAGDPAFAQGLAEARDHRKAGLLHLLFSARSRPLAGEIARDQASSYLSGLIIGEDVAAAAALFDFHGPVTLICTPALAALYGLALADYGVAVVDGEAAARAGLHSAWRSLFA